MERKLTIEQNYLLEQILEWIDNAFRRDLNLSTEEDNELELEIKARIFSYFNNQ